LRGTPSAYPAAIVAMRLGRFARRDVGDGKNARRNHHCRLHRRWGDLRRLSAVKCIAGPDEIKMIGGPEHQSVGGRKASRDSGKKRGERFEREKLVAVFRIAWIVGRGEMAHHQVEIYSSHHRRFGGEAAHITDGKAEAMKPRIDVEGSRKFFAARSAQRRPRDDVIERREYGLHG
jgi:hypothetical protein